MKKKLSLRATLLDLQKKVEYPGRLNIATYGLKFSNGVERHQIYDVCHARAKLDFNYYDRALSKDTEVVELSNLITPCPDTNIPKLRKWVKFIIQDSIFSKYFLTKNVQAAWRYGVQMDVNKSLSCCVASLIALREGWEFPNLLNHFDTLTKEGVNSNVSYLLSRMADGELSKEYFGGHQTIGGTISVKQAATLLKEGLNEHDDPVRTNSKHYRIFLATRSEPEDRRTLQTRLLKGAKEKDLGWGDKSLYLTKKQFIDNAKEIEKELLA